MKEMSRFEKIVIFTFIAVLIAALSLLCINIALRSVSKSGIADGEEEEAGMYISNAVSTDAGMTVDEEQAQEENVEDLPAEEIPEEVTEEVPAEEIPEEVTEEVAAEEIPEEVTEEVPVEEIPEEVTEEVPAEEIPAEVTEEVPAEEIPAEVTEEVPAEENIEEAAEEVPAEENAEEAAEEVPAEENAEEAAEEVPAEENAEEAAEEVPAEENAEETAEEVPAEENAEEVAEEVPAEENAEETAEELPAEEEIIDTTGMRSVQLLASKGETTVIVYKAPDDEADILDWYESGIWVSLEDYDDVWSTIILDNIRCYVRNRNVVLYGSDDITEEEQQIFRSVYITYDLGENKEIKSGTPVTFTAHLRGFENEEYTVQWSYSVDGVNFTDIGGANDLTYTVALNRQNIKYTWHVEVTLVENEPAA